MEYDPLPNWAFSMETLYQTHPNLFSMQAGFWETMLMLFIGYLVVVLTVLSISAIATSATVEGGGVYCILNNTPIKCRERCLSMQEI